MRAEIDQYLQQSPLAIFYGLSHFSEGETVYWDTARHPDFRSFLKTAEKAGVRLVIFNQEQFALDDIDEMRERLEGVNLAREERRKIENRIREIQKYEGFTSRVELLFYLEHRTHLFYLEADWYQAWDDIVSEVEAAEEEDDGSLDDDSLSGYFSTN